MHVEVVRRTHGVETVQTGGLLAWHSFNHISVRCLGLGGSLREHLLESPQFSSTARIIERHLVSEKLNYFVEKVEVGEGFWEVEGWLDGWLVDLCQSEQSLFLDGCPWDDR
jgi:hypothetical protein